MPIPRWHHIHRRARYPVLPGHSVQDIPPVIALTVAIIGLYGVVGLLSVSILQKAVSACALAACRRPLRQPCLLLVRRFIDHSVRRLVPFLLRSPVSSSISRSCQSQFCFSALDSTGETNGKKNSPGGEGTIFGNGPQLTRLCFGCQTCGDGQRTDDLGARSRPRYRAGVGFRMPQLITSTRFPCWDKRIRRCRLVCLRDRACIRQNQRSTGTSGSSYS